MKPSQLAKTSESSHQQAFMAYCAVAAMFGFEQADFYADTGFVNKNAGEPIDGLEWIYHIPNGGLRGSDRKSQAISGGRLKAEGVKSGVSDIHWPVPMGQYCGLYIEMKKPGEKPVKTTSKGGVSDEQLKFGNFVTSVGHCFKVCYSWQEAVNALKQYCGYNPI